MAHKKRPPRGGCEPPRPHDAQLMPVSEPPFAERYIGVDETDRAVPALKLHVLKTRSSSEQNLIMKTSTLRKGCLSMSTLDHCDRLNNNNDDDSSLCDCKKSPEDSDEKTDLAKMKNCNVYSVARAKAVRRRSLPALPKLIGQKLHEHNHKSLMPKSADGNDIVAAITKDIKERTFRTLSRGIGRLLKRHSSVNISEPDPVFKVAYLGNVLTGWAKGEGCVDKPLSTLWRNYNQSTKPDVVMKLSITNSGLKGITKEHGLTEYWAHRITFCTSPPEFPKIFCWVYRHEGRKLKHELRCHAVLCTKESVSKRIASELQAKIHQALIEFKRDKIARQNARLSLANCVYENPSLPRRKILLSVGGNNYKPPLERSKSAPKLMAIEELCSEEDDDDDETAPVGANRTTFTKETGVQKTRHNTDVTATAPSTYSPGRRRNEFDRLQTIDIVEMKTNDVEDFHESDDVDRDECKNSSSDDENVDEVKRSDSTGNLFVSSEENDLDLVLSKMHLEDDEDDNEVFYLETKHVEKLEHKQIDKETDSNMVSNTCNNTLCEQPPVTNFVVVDSDEGSISSGCETASTVTTSDIEMSSLPCPIAHLQDYPEKVSVLQRVQSFEQLFMRERDDTLKRPPKRFNNHHNHHHQIRRFYDDDSGVSSGETGPPSTEVNLEPLGEKNLHRLTYLRCSTYPPDSLEVTTKESIKGREDDDSDSACSVESGYSELLDSFKFDKNHYSLITDVHHVC